MDIAGRLEQSEARLLEEKNKIKQEKLARTEALDLMKAAQAKEKELAEELLKANREKS